MATSHTKSPTQISDFRKRFSIRTQNEVRKWLNRFFRGAHDNESRFWSAQLISYESNGMLQRANDVIWGMLNEKKGLADGATAMGMCELLMVEKKYKHCLMTSIELTFLQGSGADPVNKKEMEEAGLIDMHEEFPFVGSSCIPYLSISAAQLEMGMEELHHTFLTEAQKHADSMGRYRPSATPADVWEAVEGDLKLALLKKPRPPRYRIAEPILSLNK